MPPPNTEDSCDDSNKSDVEYIYIYTHTINLLKSINELSLLAHCPHSQDFPQTSQHLQPACDDNLQLGITIQNTSSAQ